MLTLDVPDAGAARLAHRRKDWELRLLQEVRSAVAEMTQVDDLLRTTVVRVAEAFGPVQVGLYLIEGDQLVLHHQVGFQEVTHTIPLGRGVVGRAAETREPQLIPDVSADPTYIGPIAAIQSEICCPFSLGERVVGVINIESRRGLALDEDDLYLLTEIAGLLDLAIRHAGLATAVRSSEQRLRHALDSAALGMWEHDVPAGTIAWSSQMSALYGVEPPVDAVTVEEWQRRIYAEDVDYVRSATSTTLAFKDDIDLEYRIVLPSGVIRWIHGKGSVSERGELGEPVRMIGIATDVTGRKRLEEERLRLVHSESARAHAEEAQRRITDTLERLSAGFVAIDSASWRITFLNSQAADLLGQPRGDLLGRAVADAFADLRDTRLEERLRAVVSAQTPEKFDVEVQPKGWTLEVHASPSPDGLSLYLQDVSEHRAAERERQLIEERFRSLVLYASDIILILERNGVVRYVSPAIERVLGVPAEEFVGSDNVFRVHPQDKKRLRRSFVQVCKMEGVSAPIVLRFQHRSGGYRWLEVTATNLFHDPTVRGIVANCSDVTERHEAEFNLWLLAETSAVLVASLDLTVTLEALVHLLVMNLAECCVVDVLDDTGRATRAVVGHRVADQEAKLRRYRDRYPMDVMAKEGPGFVARTGWPLLYEVLDEDITSEMTRDPEQLAELESFGLRSTMSVTLNARGIRLGVLTLSSTRPGRFAEKDLGLVEEIARRAALAIDNARLYRASTEAVANRDTFLSVAAHELRTPITAITGFATLLGREIVNRNEPARVERYVDRIGTAGVRLATLVNDMLDVSRTQFGELPLRIGELDLGQLIQRIVGRTVEPLGDLHVVTVTLPEHECPVEGDEDRLEQVFSNIVENAIKYSPGGGPIDVRLDANQVGYHLRVSDTGMGLPAVSIESIFLPFGRAENAMASHLPGLGIGLYIARHIIERHGGRIWAVSAGEGKGLTMHTELPRRQVGPAAEA